MLSFPVSCLRFRFAAALAITAAACDQPPPKPEAPRVTVWDSAGIEIVENRAPEWGDSTLWSVDPEPEFVIGGTNVIESPDDPSQLIWRVRGLARLFNGNILVHSGGEEAVFLFEPTGDLVTRIGRKGQGPGEFVRPRHIQVLPGDTIVVWDYGFTRVNYFDSMGTFVGARQLDVATVLDNTRTATEHSPESIKIPLSDGSFVVQRKLRDYPAPRPGEIQRPPLEYLRIDTDYSLHSFGWWRMSEGLGTTNPWSYPSPPFPVYPHVAAAAGDPLLIYVVDGEWYGIHQFAPDGTLRRIIRRETDPVPITPEELSDWKRSARDGYGDAGWPEWERALASAPPREFHPAIRRLVVDTEGFLWVWGPRSSGADVFDYGGRWWGSVEGVPADVRWIDEEMILVLRSDPDTDVERIEGYRLRRDCSGSAPRRPGIPGFLVHCSSSANGRRPGSPSGGGLVVAQAENPVGCRGGPCTFPVGNGSTDMERPRCSCFTCRSCGASPSPKLPATTRARHCG